MAILFYCHLVDHISCHLAEQAIQLGAKILHLIVADGRVGALQYSYKDGSRLLVRLQIPRLFLASLLRPYSSLQFIYFLSVLLKTFLITDEVPLDTTQLDFQHGNFIACKLNLFVVNRCELGIDVPFRRPEVRELFRPTLLQLLRIGYIDVPIQYRRCTNVGY